MSYRILTLYDSRLQRNFPDISREEAPSIGSSERLSPKDCIVAADGAASGALFQRRSEARPGAEDYAGDDQSDEGCAESQGEAVQPHG